MAKKRVYHQEYKILIAIPAPMGDKKIAENTSAFCEINAMHKIAVRDAVQARVPEVARNTLIDRFLNDPMYKDMTHVFFLDADTCPFNPYALRVLRGLDKDVISMVTPTFWEDEKKFRWNVKVDDGSTLGRALEIDELPNKLFKCHAVGGSAILVRRNVLEKLEKPYMKTTWNEDITNFQQGEDYYFCQKIKEAGFDLWVDPEIVCKHFHTVDLLEMMG